jgi:uncharacterized protein with gpF-like domain
MSYLLVLQVVKVTNFATLETFDKSGVVEGKEWFTALDERVRPTHQAVHGVVVGKGEDFSVGVDKMSAPTLGSIPAENINCRCTVLPIVKGTKRTLKPISTLRKGHKQLKVMEKREVELASKITKLEKVIQSKYQELEKEIPELKAKVIQEERQKAEEEKEALLSELRELRQKAIDVIEK